MKTTALSMIFSLLPAGLLAADGFPAHHAKRIYDAAPAEARVTPKQPRRVLIWNTPDHLMDRDPHKGYCIPYGWAALEALGRKTGAFEPVVSFDLARFLPESLGRFDAIVMNNSSGPWITPTDADLEKETFREYGADKAAVEQVLRQSLLDFIANGGGVVCLHYAIAANAHWPAFQELLGAKFTGHPWNEEIGVVVEEPAHPLVAAFGGKDFRIADEIYEYGPPYDRSKVRVLLSLDPATSNMGVKWINRRDNDFALAWVKSHGLGRVFNTSFGHRTELFWDPRVLAFYLDAIQFACGDLEAPTTPRPGRPVPRVPGSEPAAGLPGFVSLFNGRDLAGWQGDPRIWSVREGAIVGETTETVGVKENDFLLWKDEIEDFELHLKFRLQGGNSGVYYRARKRPPGEIRGEPLVGTQADFSADGRWTGVIMEYTLREVLAEHHLTGRLHRYPLVIVPEWSYLDPGFQQELRDYVREGGRLLLIGRDSARLFEQELGVKMDWAANGPGLLRYLAQGAETVAVHGPEQFSATSKVREIGRLHTTADPESSSFGPAAVSVEYGRGIMAATTFAFSRNYLSTRSPVFRGFLDQLVRELFPDPLVEVSGSHDVDVVLNQSDGKVSVHLINTAGPHRTEGILETIPPVGPLQIKVRVDAAPSRVTLQPENRAIPFRYRNGGVECELSELKIYDILVLE